jgi:hypothetical protein
MVVARFASASGFDLGSFSEMNARSSHNIPKVAEKDESEVARIVHLSDFNQTLTLKQLKIC